jgi:hypothetical protein
MKKKYYILFLLSVLISLKGHADEPVIREMDFFNSEELLHITLYFNVHEFLRTKSEPRNFDALLTVKTSESDSVSQQVKVKARGEMRRIYCSFPPVMIKFGDYKLKLVTHCNQSEMNESYVFKEYLAYKLFNLVTPYSFKTRLVKINYIDVENPKRSVTAYGFLIENDNDMAARNDAVVVNNEMLSQRHMNDEDMARVALFNYMIGNTDWSVMKLHNVKVLVPADTFTNRGIPVVYDFDYSGFVKTSYSAPSKNIPIKLVTERYYMGNCITASEMTPVLEEFENLHADFIKTIKEFEYLSPGSKKKLEYYINGFFKEQKNQDFLLSEINKTCREN